MEKNGHRNQGRSKHRWCSPTPSYSYDPTDDGNNGSPDGAAFNFGPGFTNSSPSDDESTPAPTAFAYHRGSSYSQPMSEDAVYSGSNDGSAKMDTKFGTGSVATVPDPGLPARQSSGTSFNGASFHHQSRNRPARHYNTPVRNGDERSARVDQFDCEDDGFEDGLDLRSPPKGGYQGRYHTATTTPSAPSRLRFPNSNTKSASSRAQNGGSRFAATTASRFTRPSHRPSHNAPISRHGASSSNYPNRSTNHAYRRPPGLTSPPSAFRVINGQHGARESVCDDLSTIPPRAKKDDEATALHRSLRMAENEIDHLRDTVRNNEREIRRLLRSAESSAKAAALHQRVKDDQAAAAIAEQKKLRQELVQLAGVRHLNRVQKLIFGNAAPDVFDIPGEIENLKIAKETLGELFLRSVEKVDTLSRMLQALTSCLMALRDSKSETVITVIARTVDTVERGLSPMRKAAHDLKTLPGGGLAHVTPPSEMLRTIAGEIFDADRVAVQLGCVNAFNSSASALLNFAEKARKKGSAEKRGRWMDR